MPIISGGKYADGAFGLYLNAGTPVNGTSEVQTLTKSGTLSAGTFKLSFRGELTAALNYNATAAEIVAALEALPSVGTGGVTATGGAINSTAVVVTFAANLGKRAIPELIVLALNSLTGSSPTIGIAETTPGVDATALGAPKGALLIDTTGGSLYSNTGTPAAPAWSATTTAPSELTDLLAAIPTAAVADIATADGVAVSAANGTTVATADGSDAATTQALANALKVQVNVLVTLANANKAEINALVTLANANKAKINDLLAKLRTAGLVTP